jgi:hypothetical protein
MGEIHAQINDYMKEVQQKRNDRINRRRGGLREYSPGDLVKFRIHEGVRNKLDPYWSGPATVLRRIGPVDYELEYRDEPTGRHPVVHTSYLRPYFPEEDDGHDEPNK